MHFINFENEIYPSKDEIYPSKNDMNSGSNHSNSSYSNRPGPKILLGVTGSVAAVKSPEIAVRLALGVNAEVKVLLTKGGENFWGKAEGYNKKYWDMMQDIIQRAYLSDDDLLREEKGSITIYSADDEWKHWDEIGDPVFHIILRDWADLLLIAPLSAHTLAKISNGLCDDTLSCVIRAWDFGHGDRPGKPIIMAPAMNSAMYQHPLTKQQLETIRGFWNPKNETDAKEGVSYVCPQTKKLACGEVGVGALASVEDIVKCVIINECLKKMPKKSRK